MPKHSMCPLKARARIWAHILSETLFSDDHTSATILFTFGFLCSGRMRLFPVVVMTNYTHSGSRFFPKE